MKDKIFGVLQRVGRSFMLPIALLPIAGLLLGIGSSFTNPTTIETYHLQNVITEGGVLYTLLDIMSKTGSAVFDNLALLFAMGVAIGMAKKEKEVAALSGAIGFLVMNTAISALIHAKGGVEAMAANSTASVLGITTLQTGVFGGILVGLGVAALHNRFYKIRLPQVLSFFRRHPVRANRFRRYLPGSGRAPVLCMAGGTDGHRKAWESGAQLWLRRHLDLRHHRTCPDPLWSAPCILYAFWQTELGGSMRIDGVTVTGAQNIFFCGACLQIHTGVLCIRHPVHGR